jgi:F420-non-reducing hydrogenase small subunit
VICLGIATRDGCGASCIGINMPCRGCFGPVEGVRDAGLKMISTLAAIIDAESDADINRVAEQVVDIAGYGYRFSLPSSLMGSLKHRNGVEGE